MPPRFTPSDFAQRELNSLGLGATSPFNLSAMNFNFTPVMALLPLVLSAAFVLLVLHLLRAVFRPEPGEVARSWKFRTVVWIGLALIVPLWPVTFPLFLWLAHRSYLAGSPRSTGAAA